MIIFVFFSFGSTSLSSSDDMNVVLVHFAPFSACSNCDVPNAIHSHNRLLVDGQGIYSALVSMTVSFTVLLLIDFAFFLINISNRILIP